MKNTEEQNNKVSSKNEDAFFEKGFKIYLGLGFLYFYVMRPFGIVSPHEDQIMLVLMVITIAIVILYFISHNIKGDPR